MYRCRGAWISMTSQPTITAPTASTTGRSSHPFTRRTMTRRLVRVQDRITTTRATISNGRLSLNGGLVDCRVIKALTSSHRSALLPTCLPL